MLVLGAKELDGWAEEMVETSVIYLSDFVDDGDWITSQGVRNPHFWMDPIAVQHIIPDLTARICVLDEENCEHIKENAARFNQQLERLHVEIESEMRPFSGKQLVTSQGFFDYFLNRYGLISAGTLESIPGHEPTPARIIEILNDARGKAYLGIIAQSRLPDTAARLFRDESGLPLVYLDPVGTRSDTTYASFLLRNVQALKLAFSELP
jgi:ABC-type Zn uptake system ZnuABC Zn-binding protein ZnuA